MLSFLRRLISFPVALALALPASLWTRYHERRILLTGRSLTHKELCAARLAGVAHPERIRITSVPRIPNPLNRIFSRLERIGGACVSNASGITFYYGIYVTSRDSEDAALLRHEFVHTGQYERLGGHAAFLSRYLFQCMTVGYHAAPLEEEARERAG